jgi:lysophospholipase L1-like esterase
VAGSKRSRYSRTSKAATSSSSSGSTSTGIYVPPQWGTNWKAKLAAAKAGTGLARVACVGDSITVGQFASNLDTKNWPGLVRTALQASFGDGGSGFKSVMDTALVLNSSSYTAAVASSSLIALSGTWTVGTTVPDGPGAQYILGTTTGASATYSVRGTSASVIYLAGSTTGWGNMTITIDGTLAATINTNTGSNAVTEWTSSTLSAGSHTVVVAAPAASGGTNQVFLCGVSGRNATGVVVDKYARSSFPSQAFNGLTAQTWVSSTITYGGSGQGGYGTPAKWAGGSARPADLVIYAMGVNDSHLLSPVAPDTYIRNVRGYLDEVKDGTGQDGSTDVMLILPHRGAPSFEEQSTNYYANYTARLRGLAEAYNAAFIDYFPIGRNSWNYWNSLGYWGNNGFGDGRSGTDPVHLSDAGFQAMADAITPIVTAT